MTTLMQRSLLARNALFFEIGKAAIGFYIGKQGLELTYGAAASIVVVLIWVYYTSQIILMGAEITHSYAEHNGSLKRLSEERPRRCREAAGCDQHFTPQSKPSR